MKGQCSNLEILHLLLGSRSGLEGRKDWSGTNDVYSDMFRSELKGERSGEGDDGSLSGGVVDHRGGSLEGSDGGGVNDGSSGFHVGYSRPIGQ